MQKPGSTGLTLDLYHLDSAYVAWKTGRSGVATFELSSRSHPFGGAYLLVAGLEPAVRFALEFAFSEDDLAYIRDVRGYEDGFLEVLRGHRFTGDIWAMPEGTVAFAGEPLVRVTAPFAEALLLESGMLHDINLSTLIATKTARIVRAARGHPVAEFGLRRAHEPYLAVRSAWIGGVASTSFVDAAKRFDIPPTGTIPHALVQAYRSEEQAFRAVAATLPSYTLLLDTYDVERAIQTAVEVARWAMREHGHTLRAVRLDSGDMASQARVCRTVLDDAGLHDVQIFASGDLDEFRIAELLADDPQIDGFGVGTSLATGAGAAARGVDGGSLASIYKLVWYDDRHPLPAVKRAGAKSTWPGIKQVWRTRTHDVIGLADDAGPGDGRPLLEPVVRDGALTAPFASLTAARERASAQLAALRERYARPENPDPYPVERSTRLRALRDAALAEHGF